MAFETLVDMTPANSQASLGGQNSNGVPHRTPSPGELLKDTAVKGLCRFN